MKYILYETYINIKRDIYIHIYQSTYGNLCAVFKGTR